MKFLHLCTSIKSGAGRIPLMIHQECLQRGHGSSLFTRDKLSAPPKGVTIFHEHSEKSISEIKHRISSKFASNADYIFLNKNERRYHLSAQKILNIYNDTPDVICSYWNSRAYNMATLRDLNQQTGAPVVFVLTDMAPYTGGCHYAWNCRGYEVKCSNCPAIKNRWFKSKASRNLEQKKAALRDVKFEVIASRGQALESAQQSALFAGRTIHANVHKVGSHTRDITKHTDRQALNLPEDRVILLLAATDLTDGRKGGQDAIAALNRIYKSVPIDNERILVLIVGKKSEEIAQQLSFETRCMQHVNFEIELPKVLGASDLFISTSRMDTGPYMINLAIYHNCPVVAYPIGVACFLVGEEGAGFLADEISPVALAQEIEKFLMLNQSGLKVLSVRCQRVTKKHLLWDDEFFSKLSCGKIGKRDKTVAKLSN